MLSFLRRGRKEVRSAQVSEPVWAVGDIHGCSELLDALLLEIVASNSDHRPIRIIFLGDYVDRASGSPQVLDRLIGLQSDTKVRPSFIRGNHDFMMQEFLLHSEMGPAWLKMGAAATLMAYGVPAPSLTTSPSAWRETQARFREAVPKRHRAFLDALEPWAVEGDYYFTHAGVRPGRSLSRQCVEDLMWIRKTFLGDTRRLSKLIVHGHTVSDEPFEDHRRIGLDTGAYASGRLTAVQLQGDRRRYLQIRRTQSGVLPVWDVAPSGAH